jgi:hypothetical protein
MTEPKQKVPLAWPAIEAAIQNCIEHPRDGCRPVDQSVVALFRSMLALCETHTGLRPHRVVTSSDPSLVAYYFTQVDGHYGVIEVYPDDEHEADDPPTVIGWGDHFESLTIAQAAEGHRFKSMAVGLGVGDATPEQTAHQVR